MKYVVRIELNKPVFKADYRRTVISFFKSVISNYMDGEFYSKFYESGAEHKKFVWSIKLPVKEFAGDHIELKSTSIELTLKFSDAETALIYYSGVLEYKGKPFNIGMDNSMRVTGIKMLKIAKIGTELAAFKIFSPICLRQHEREKNEDRYISIENKEFALELNNKLKEDFPYNHKDIDELEYNFDNLRKVVVKAFGLYIDATIGTFLVKGNTEILNKMCERGVGSKRNSGFGMIEAIPLEVSHDS